AIAARRTGNHRSQPALSGSRHADAGTARPRLRVAGHRHARVDGGSLELRADDREPAGTEGLLPGGNRVPERLDRRRAGAAPGRAAGQERLRAVSPATGPQRAHRMKILRTELPECVVIEPQVHGDARGFFYESFHAGKFAEAGLDLRFVQTNVSRSARGVLRGMHYQWPNPQGKLVSVLEGAVYDVAVDIRRGSPTFGKWAAVVLTGDNKRHFWIPEGFAHGFAVLSDHATFMYQ